MKDSELIILEKAYQIKDWIRNRQSTFLNGLREENYQRHPRIRIAVAEKTEWIRN